MSYYLSDQKETKNQKFSFKNRKSAVILRKKWKVTLLALLRFWVDLDLRGPN